MFKKKLTRSEWNRIVIIEMATIFTELVNLAYYMAKGKELSGIPYLFVYIIGLLALETTAIWFDSNWSTEGRFGTIVQRYLGISLLGLFVIPIIYTQLHVNSIYGTLMTNIILSIITCIWYMIVSKQNYFESQDILT